MNKNIEVERFPLPNIESLFDRLGEELRSSEEKVFIASFDIQSAYRALEVHSKDENKLTFSFESDMFFHERMPFGLADAPSTFSYVMRIVLNGISGVYNYLDDLIIVRRGLNKFTETLDKLFERLLHFGILLKPSKCEIGLKEIPFLGHVLTSTGIKIQPEKVKAITDLRPPSSQDELRSVLGMFNYHHNSVENLYTILQPLFELLKISNKFIWTRKCQDAFNKAKQAVSSATEKRHRDTRLPLVLSTDASDVGCGAVLYQKRGEDLEPLQYFSRNFSISERKLPIRSRELLSIALAIKNFETILVGENFTVLTDHKSLIYLNNTAIDALSIKTRNILWYLSHFSFTIAHVSGTDKRNKIADCLSRAVAFKPLTISEADIFDTVDDFRDLNNLDVEKEIVTPEIQSALAQIFDAERLKLEQKDDKEISKLFEGHKSNLSDILKDKKGRIFILESLADSVIQFIHIKKSHLATEKLVKYLSAYFVIRNLSQKCSHAVKSCMDCIASKEWPKLVGDKQKKQHIVSGPFVKVYCDIIDLGQNSKNGKRYGLTYMDSLTRHLDCIALPDKKQETVSKALIQLILRWGLPESIVTDNGSEFVNLTNNLLTKVFGIYVSHISPYNPRGNLVERAHKEMKKLFRLYNVQIDTWDEWLPLILFSYNSATHGALPEISPFEALFLRKPKDVPSCGRSIKLSDEWLKRFPQLQPFEDLVRHSINKFNNKKVSVKKPFNLRRGEKVMVFHHIRKGESSKLHRFWSGPFTVIEKTSPGVYRLMNDSTSQRILRHIRLIRLCNLKTSDSSPQAPQDNLSEELGSSASDTAPSEDEAPPPLPTKTTRRGRIITKPTRFQD